MKFSRFIIIPLISLPLLFIIIYHITFYYFFFYLIKCKKYIDQKRARQAYNTSWKPAEQYIHQPRKERPLNKPKLTQKASAGEHSPQHKPKKNLELRNNLPRTSNPTMDDTTKRLMSSPKCRSVEVINNPIRPGSNHRKVNCINYK